MEYRHPHLILGVDYGATPDEATLAFARKAKRVRRDPDAPFTLEDLTWALNQLEQTDEAPGDTFVHLRVPADPDAYLDLDLDTSSSRVPGLARLSPHDPTAVASLRDAVRRRGQVAAASDTQLASSTWSATQPPHLPPFPELPRSKGPRRPAARTRDSAHDADPSPFVGSAGGTAAPRRRWLIVGVPILLLIAMSAAGFRLLAQPQPEAQTVTRAPNSSASTDAVTADPGQVDPGETTAATAEPSPTDLNETTAAAGPACATDPDTEGQPADDCPGEQSRARDDAQVPGALPLALRQLQIGLPQPAIVLGSEERRAVVVAYREGITETDVRAELREWARAEGWDLVHEATDIHPRLSACDVYLQSPEVETGSSADYLSVQFVTPLGSDQLRVIEEYGVTGPFIEVTLGDWLEDCGAEPLPPSSVPEEPPLWVAQLASVPTDAGPEELESVYQDVLTQVPTAIVITSDDFASLRSGYYVVIATDSFRDGYAALDFCSAHGRTDPTACVGRYLSDVVTDSHLQCTFDDRRSEVCTRS